MRSRAPGPDPITQTGEISTIRTLLPYLWPAGENGLRGRVVIAMVLLIAAKATNVSVPIFYKQAVDILTAGGTVPVAVSVPVVFDNGSDLVVAAAPADLAAETFGPSVEQVARNLRGSGRKDPTVEVRLRRVEPQGDGVDRPVVLATAVRDWATGDVTVSVNAKR